MNPITQPWAKYYSDQLNAATSNTYGKGIDPSSVPELLEVLRALTIHYFDGGILQEQERLMDLAKTVLDKATLK